jgi:hypothetical protein
VDDGTSAAKDARNSLLHMHGLAVQVLLQETQSILVGHRVDHKLVRRLEAADEIVGDVLSDVVQGQETEQTGEVIVHGLLHVLLQEDLLNRKIRTILKNESRLAAVHHGFTAVTM